MGAQRVERGRPSFTRSCHISGGHESFRSMWSRFSPQTRSVSAPALWNKRHKRAPLPVLVTPSLSSSRRAAKCRCLPETVPANCMNPQSNLMRQVMLRRRRIQQCGRLDRGRVLSVRVAGHPSAWSILLHLQERCTSSTVNVYDESLQFDNPESKFLESMLKELQFRCEAL